MDLDKIIYQRPNCFIAIKYINPMNVIVKDVAPKLSAQLNLIRFQSTTISFFYCNASSISMTSSIVGLAAGSICKHFVTTFFN